MRSGGCHPAALAATLPSLALALVTLALACPSAQASTEGCPAGHGGNAAVEWGINGSEQLAAGFRSVHEGAPNQVLGLGNVRSVQAGFKFAVALLGNCTLVSWGSNTKEQLGNGNHLQAQNRPAPVVNLESVNEVSVANAHTAALRYDGTVWTWGASEFGERGNGEKGWERSALSGEPQLARPRDEPAQVPGLEHVAQLATGGMRDFALLASGEVVAWGENQNGDLGIEQAGGEEEQCYGENHLKAPVPCSAIPRRVKVEGRPLTGVERIVAGGEAAYAVRNGGRELLAWGENSKGQLGTGDTERHPTPRAVMFTPPSPVVELEGGAHHVFARLANGQVYAWGADDSGQLRVPRGGRRRRSVRPARLRDHADARRVAHPRRPARGGGSQQPRAERGRRRPEGDLQLRAQRHRGTARPRGSGAGKHLHAHPDQGAGVGRRDLGELEHRPRLRAGRHASAAAAVGDGGHRSPRSRLDRAGRSVPPAMEAGGHKTVEQTARTRSHLPRRKRLCLPADDLRSRAPALRSRPRRHQAHGRQSRARKVALHLRDAGAGAGSAAQHRASRHRWLPQQGQSATASVGTWTNSPTAVAYQWLRCEGYGEGGGEEELGEECEPIEGATGASYTPQAVDARRSLRVTVKASNLAGWSLAVSRPEVVLGNGEETLALAPESTSGPTVTGVAVQGKTLTEHHAAWEGEVAAYSYKWLRCKARTTQGTGGSCSAITGASGQSYTLTGQDAGMWIEVQETAANSGGWNFSTSEALEAIPPEVPLATAPPGITGTIQQGQTLTVREGTWTNNAKAPSWQWLRCGSTGSGCTAIAGATKKTYKLEGEDVGHTLTVSETVENAVGRSAPATSAPTTAVPVPPPAPESTSLPTVTGLAQQGQVLAEHAGGWSGEPTTYSYAWKRCSPTGTECKAITSATKQTYQLTSADVGHTIVAKETAANAGGSTPANSAATATVAGVVPLASSPPALQGIAQQEQPLTASTGTWTGEPTAYSYQWLQCNPSGAACTAIGGASASSYTPAAALVGATIRVRVSAVNATGEGAPATSETSAQVLPAPPAAVANPTITGVTAEGQPLTAHAGSWSTAPPATRSPGCAAKPRPAPRSRARAPRSTRSPLPTSARQSSCEKPPATPVVGPPPARRPPA